MPRIPKLILWLAILIAGIYLVLYIAVAAWGKKIVTAQIEKNLHLEADIAGMGLGFPFTVNIHKLNIEGLFKADSISVTPSLLGFLAGRLILNDLKIIRPEVIVEKNEEGRINLMQFAGRRDSASKSGKHAVLLAGLRIRDGRVIFVDRQIDPSGYRIKIKNINIDIAKASLLPTSLLIRFNLSGLLADAGDNPKGNLSGSGWADFGPKNMEGKITLSNGELNLLAPYSRGRLAEQLSGSAKLNFNSDLKAENNDLAAKCHVELISLTGGTKGQQFLESVAPSDLLLTSLLNLLSTSSGKLVFDFTVNTKLDHPRIDPQELKRAILRAAEENLAAQSPEELIEKVKNTVEQFKDFGKTIQDIFKKQE